MKKPIFFLLCVVFLMTGCIKVQPAFEVEIRKTQKFSGQSYSADILKNQQFSILIWLKSEVNYPWASLFSMGDDSSHYMQVSLNGTNTEGNRCGINFAYKNGEELVRVFSSENHQVETNLYNQIAVTYDGKDLVLYLNGKEIGRELCKIKLNSFDSDQLVVGKSLFFDDPVITGEYDLLYYSNSLLSSKDIETDFEQRYPVELLDSLPFVDRKDVDGITLPENPYHGYYLSYFLEENDWLFLEGNKLVQKDYPLENAEIELKTIIEHEGELFEKTVAIPVYNQYSKIQSNTQEWLQNSLGYFLESGSILPEKDKNGTLINWSLQSDCAFLENG